jgi:hypothetical protein
MILDAKNLANPWAPTAFDRFAAHYPATEWVAAAALDRGDGFLDIWERAVTRVLPRELCIVLTPGLFAEWLPTCFRAARQRFATDGHRVLLTTTRSALGVRAQAAELTKELLSWLRPAERFLWCAHSKGGLDALWALHASPSLRERCSAIVVVQPPVGRSWLIDSWTATRAAWRARARAALLHSRWFRDGVRDISSRRDALVTGWLESFVPALPMLHAVSWSVRATSWVDSYHRELNGLRPGHAHDGQFYLADQRLPSTAIVGLANIDHAQPVLGGHGLDAARLWRALAACAWHEAGR